MREDAEFDVQVVLALPARQQVVTVRVPLGCSARAAVLLAEENGLDFSGSGGFARTASLGIYSEKVSDEHAVNAGDRIEIYRPLHQDPMILRRKRAAEATKKKSR